MYCTITNIMLGELRRLYKIMQTFIFFPFVFIALLRDFVCMYILHCLSVTKVLDYFKVITCFLIYVYHVLVRISIVYECKTMKI